MKKNWAALVFTLVQMSVVSFAQQNMETLLYTKNGFLRVNDTLSITNTQLKVWKRAEDNIISILSSYIKYPEMYSAVGFQGRIIAAFTFDSLGNSSVTLIKGLANADEKFILNQLVTFAPIMRREFKYVWQERDYSGTYYVPLDFEIINPHKKTRENGAIPITTTEQGLISRDSYCPGSKE